MHFIHLLPTKKNKTMIEKDTEITSRPQASQTNIVANTH